MGAHIMNHMNQAGAWLLDGPPWVQYRARRDLLGQPEDESPVLEARQAMLAHPQVEGLLAELAEWPGSVLKNHKDASHLLHKLTFAADLGLRAGDPGVDQVIGRILDQPAEKGPFQVRVNINPRYGGTGEDQWAWMLCDAPLVLYAMLKFGLADDPQVQSAVHCLVSLIRENGWPCAVSPALRRFRGPGRKADPCPYANLAMLKALSQIPDLRDDEAARTGAETLLVLWEQRKERRPYLFAMGTLFGRLKAPLIWYDILHVVEVLTQFSWLRQDARLEEMVAIVRSKMDEQGRFTAESVWRAWKEWDFGQKRSPSFWLTLLAHRMLRRLDASLMHDR
jgi:hypothetical protein